MERRETITVTIYFCRCTGSDHITSESSVTVPARVYAERMTGLERLVLIEIIVHPETC